MLSGYTPYLSAGASHPNPLLHSKLEEQPHRSLLEQVDVWNLFYIFSCCSFIRPSVRLTASLSLSHSLFRIWSTCVRGWRADRPIPWQYSSIRCCCPTAISGWITPRRWNGGMSWSVRSLIWCWGRAHLEELGMYERIDYT